MQYRLDEEDVYKLKSIYIMVKLHEAIKHKPNSEMSFIPNTYLGSAVENQKFILKVIENNSDEIFYHEQDTITIDHCLNVEKHLLVIGLFSSTRFIIRIDESSLSNSIHAFCRIDVGSGSENDNYKYGSVSLNIDLMWNLKDDSSKLLQYFESSMRPVIVDILRQSIIDVDW